MRNRLVATPILAIARRDWLISRSYRLALAFDVFSAFFALAIYYFVSRTFANARPPGLGEAPTYFAFALAGVVLAMLIQSAALALGRRLREEQLTGTFEALIAQPLRDVELAIGLATFPFGFAAFRSTVYLLIAGLVLDAGFGNADWVGWVVIVATTTTFTLGFGLVIAAAVLVMKRAETVAGVVTALLAVGGGAYFPISAFPEWLQPIAELIPTRLAFEGGRAALFGGEWADEAAGLAALTLVSIPVGVWLFARSLRAQRVRGTLTEY